MAGQALSVSEQRTAASKLAVMLHSDQVGQELMLKQVQRMQLASDERYHRVNSDSYHLLHEA